MIQLFFLFSYQWNSVIRKETKKTTVFLCPSYSLELAYDFISFSLKSLLQGNHLTFFVEVKKKLLTLWVFMNKDLVDHFN